jgi:hypothetical protein
LTAATTPARSTNATTAANFNGVVNILSSSLRHIFGRRYAYAMVDDAVLDDALA